MENLFAGCLAYCAAKSVRFNRDQGVPRTGGNALFRPAIIKLFLPSVAFLCSPPGEIGGEGFESGHAGHWANVRRLLEIHHLRIVFTERGPRGSPLPLGFPCIAIQPIFPEHDP